LRLNVCSGSIIKPLAAALLLSSQAMAALAGKQAYKARELVGLALSKDREPAARYSLSGTGGYGMVGRT